MQLGHISYLKGQISDGMCLKTIIKIIASELYIEFRFIGAYSI